jgi:hypothetical protein
VKEMKERGVEVRVNGMLVLLIVVIICTTVAYVCGPR